MYQDIDTKAKTQTQRLKRRFKGKDTKKEIKRDCKDKVASS